MEKTPSRTWRLNLVFGVLMLVLVCLGVRMVLLLKDTRTKASHLARTQERITIDLPGRIGSIFAEANGTPVQLASSKQVPSCYVDLAEKVLDDSELGDMAIRVGGALGIEPIQVQNTFLARRGHRFVWLKRNITNDELAAVKALKHSAIGIKYEWTREYPAGKLCSTLVGWRQKDNAPGGGLEESENAVLMPRDGHTTISTDASKRPIREEETVLPVDGGNVYLTIDTNIQSWLEESVYASLDKSKAKWGVGVVANPNTGKILAMCSIVLDERTKKPVFFDPSDFNATSAESRTNYVICVPYEPGSAAKTIFATAAVNAGAVDWEAKLFCENGVWAVPNGGTVSDHGAHYGWMSVRDIIAQSSNIGMAKIGLKSGNALLFRFSREFGLGSKTGLGLPGESGGILRPLRNWDTYSTPRVPFGQEISVTAMQLTMAYCALFNGGTMLRPYVIDRVIDAQGNVIRRNERTVVRQAVAPAAAQGAVDAMQTVITDGTGKAARLSKWTAGGKTGTAQIPSPIPGQHGYADRAFTGTFVGGAPATNPQVVCCISIHWPRVGSHYGAVVAAPYWKDVMEKTLAYLNVPPDKAEDSPRDRGARAAHGD